MDTSHLKRCPLCESQQLTTVNVYTQTQIPGVFLKQPRRKAHLFSRKTNTSATQAITCLSCGYTALFALAVGNLIPDTQDVAART